MSTSAGYSTATAPGPSRSPLRYRREAEDDAIAAGAYLARPPHPRSTRKGKEKARAGLGPAWEIGSAGWVREGFRRFGEHCARNQVGFELLS